MLNVWFLETSSASLRASAMNISRSSKISMTQVKFKSILGLQDSHPSEKKTKSTLLAEEPVTRSGTISSEGGRDFL